MGTIKTCSPCKSASRLWALPSRTASVIAWRTSGHPLLATERRLACAIALLVICKVQSRCRLSRHRHKAKEEWEVSEPWERLHKKCFTNRANNSQAIKIFV